MPTYEIKMRGRLGYWPDDWSIGKEVRLDKCTFRRENNVMNIAIRAIVTADNEQEARRLGRDMCQAESYIFEFCANNPLNLDLTWDNVGITGSSSSTGTAVLGASLSLVGHDVTSAQIDASIGNYKSSISALTPNKRGAFRRVIRWRALAQRETDVTDRFVKFWIALETLMNTDEEEINISGRTENALIALYRKENPGKDYKILTGKEIREIKDLRRQIFHRGMYSSADLEVRLDQLEDILDDLILGTLNLKTEEKSKKYFVEI